MSHYRLSKIRQQHIKLQEEGEDNGLEPGSDMRTAKAKDKKEKFLSQILGSLNELFITDDLINYAYAVRDKLTENETVMKPLENNTADQAFPSDFPQAIDDAVFV